MTDSNPSRLGVARWGSKDDAAKLASDKKELFMKVFSGEVMATYNSNTVMKDRVRTRSISSGKSSSFAAIGKIDAEYHTPGTELTGMSVDHGEKIITINDLLVSHAFISNIDEAMNHYDVRAEYSKQMGQALAQTFDRDLLSLAWKVSNDNAEAGLNIPAVGDMGNADKVKAMASPTADTLVTAFLEAAQQFDEKNVPESGRFIVVSPLAYYMLLANDKLVSRDYSAGNGDFAGARLSTVAGMPIVKSNNMGLARMTTTAATAASNTGGNNDEGISPAFGSDVEVDARKQIAMVLHKDALGVVQLMDVKTEAEYDIRRQGTLMVSKMAVGYGVLRPEGVVGITSID